MSYKNPTVQEVVRNVHEGIRTKKDLELCGCPVCQEALKKLEGKLPNESEINRGIEIRERTIKYLEAIDRAIERIKTWYNRLAQQDETEGNTEARKVEKETLETVSRIFDEEVGKETIVKVEGEEFSEATIKVIREREDARQLKILEEEEG